MMPGAGLPRAVLFDVDGTLLHSQDAYYEIFVRALGQLGLQPPPRSVVADVMNFGTSPFDGVFPPEPDHAVWMKRYRAVAADVWPQVFATVLPLPGVPAVLAALAAAGVTLALVTASQARVVAPLRRLGLDRYFAAVVSVEDVARPKPSPDGVLAALEQLGVRPDEALLVGDTPMDVRSGRAAGVRTVAVATGTADAGLLSRYGPDLVLPDLAALLPALGLPAPAAPLRGTLHKGLGEAAAFMAITWVAEALTAMLGVAPHPGTLNLAPAGPADQQAWEALVQGPSLLLPAGQPGFCDARCFPVAVAARIPGLALVPAVPGYPPDKIELVAPVHLGRELGVDLGDVLTLAPMPAPPLRAQAERGQGSGTGAGGSH